MKVYSNLWDLQEIWFRKPLVCAGISWGRKPRLMLDIWYSDKYVRYLAQINYGCFSPFRKDDFASLKIGPGLGIRTPRSKRFGVFPAGDWELSPIRDDPLSNRHPIHAVLRFSNLGHVMSGGDSVTARPKARCVVAVSDTTDSNSRAAVIDPSSRDIFEI